MPTLFLTSGGRKWVREMLPIIYIVKRKKLNSSNERNVAFFSVTRTSPKQIESWHHGFPPWRSISLPGKEHPKISCPVGLLAGCVGSRSNRLCQVKQWSAKPTSCVQGLSQSSCTFPNESTDPHFPHWTTMEMLKVNYLLTETGMNRKTLIS